jgi:hypothetical protein
VLVLVNTSEHNSNTSEHNSNTHFFGCCLKVREISATAAAKKLERLGIRGYGGVKYGSKEPSKSMKPLGMEYGKLLKLLQKCNAAFAISSVN